MTDLQENPIAVIVLMKETKETVAILETDLGDIQDLTRENDLVDIQDHGLGQGLSLDLDHALEAEDHTIETNMMMISQDMVEKTGENILTSTDKKHNFCILSCFSQTSREPPSNTIMLRGLAQHITQEDVRLLFHG